MEQWADTCLVCGNTFFSEKEMGKHVRSHHTPPVHGGEQKLETQCPFCPHQGRSVSEMQNHLVKMHAKEMMTPEKAKKNEPTTSSMVSECVDLTGTSHQDHKNEVIICPLCGEDSITSTEALDLHVNGHFIEADEQHSSNDELLAIRLRRQEEYQQFRQSQKAAEDFNFEQLKDQHGMGQYHSNTGFRAQALRNMERGVGRSLSTFDYYNNKLEMLEKLEEGIDDGMTSCTVVLDQLKDHLRRTLRENERAWFASETDYIGRGPGDSGWGCGYRNIQMMISNLNKNPNFLQEFGQRFHGNIPSIPKIQEMIESAWNEGYDGKGKEQLSGRVVRTRKWIGATEAFSFFASLRVHCRIVDFVRPSAPNNTHPLLFQWVKDYFHSDSDSGKVIVTDKPPLYLQHEGHSRTIVGVMCRNTPSGNTGTSMIKLIIFDPGISKFGIWKKETGRKLSSKVKDNSTLCVQKFIKPISSVTERQYQVVSVVGWASPQRILEQKNVDLMSEKVP